MVFLPQMTNSSVFKSGFFHWLVLLCALVINIGLADQRSSTESADPALSDNNARDDSEQVSVFYLTNRARRGEDPSELFYSGDRGTPRFGQCKIEFDSIPVISELADRLPFYLKTETNAVTAIEQPDRAQFWDQLVGSIQDSSSHSVVLFIHGYNYSFERTCRMAAEIQRSLQKRATIVAFSWPSNGLPSDYVSDLADVEWSVPLLSGFIRQLVERFNSSHVQVVAHSMGSRGVIFALRKLAAERLDPPAIAQLVLLAPDFDSQTFTDQLPLIEPMAANISLYASDNDTPLKLSHQLNGYPRLGQAGDYLTVVKGIDTIDVSLTGRYQVTGHEYFFFNPLVADDLEMLLGDGLHASMRVGLIPMKQDGIIYWKIR